MRNKLSFDLQLSARKAAIAERIAAHKITRSKVSVIWWAAFALHSALFCWRFAAPACSPRR